MQLDILWTKIIGIIIAGALGVGSLLAYTESKYVSRNDLNALIAVIRRDREVTTNNMTEIKEDIRETRRLLQRLLLTPYKRGRK